MNEQLIKRNEKNGMVCAYCIQPHSQSKPCVYFCSGYCQRFFHEACKDLLFSSNEQFRKNNPTSLSWQCDDCLDGKAVCFCCKEKGDILLFPKKGKPMVASELLNQGLTLEEVEEKETQKGEFKQENEESEQEEFEVDQSQHDKPSQSDQNVQPSLQKETSTKIVLSLGKPAEQDLRSPAKN